MHVATTINNNYLLELLKFISQGEEVLIIHQGSPVAILSPVSIKALSETLTKPSVENPPTKHPRKPGSATGLFTMSDDFDSPLEDFKEYM